MNCEEFERKLQELESLTPPPPLEAHLRSCLPCAELMADLAHITRQARQVVPMELPSDRVWEGIQQQLAQEGLIAEPRSRRPVLLSPAWGWFPRLRMGMAYAAVFLITLGVGYSIRSNVAVPPPPEIANIVPAPPNDAPLEEDFQQLLQKVPPEKRKVYESNFHEVNSSIQQLSTFVASHPEDRFARDQLLSAFERRGRLWETMARWEEF